MLTPKTFFTPCPECDGVGKIKRRIKKSVRLRYQAALEKHKKSNSKEYPPTEPRPHFSTCLNCQGRGLIQSQENLKSDYTKTPHIAIIGAGIGGVALAVACLHRGIPFTIYERDANFNERAQGYGLTLQQASSAINSFGISNLEKGVISTRHLVHNTKGEIIAEWGMRKWLENRVITKPKKTNIHIARQSLRLSLIKQLGGNDMIKWGHKLIDFEENADGIINLYFETNKEIVNTQADLIVGADGIHSTIRNKLVDKETNPLRFLDCIVILGICQLKDLKDVISPLLDSATVFQTANGNERIYVMPFDAESVMWQLSFPMAENEAKELSSKGSEALKVEAIKRTQWHTPIPEILKATQLSKISGYPVYDREILNQEVLQKLGNATLIGDAAHPMSPFKGQGANQALLDALSLARDIYKKCTIFSDWKTKGIRATVLNNFEAEMIARSSVKVKDSAAAAEFLHSEIALYESNEPRGRVLKRMSICNSNQ
ncbi:FAD-dependent oxidoreductase [Sphingobacterium bovistauri]|uniref:FAD-dependent monooxygenase n=1 Tax=Sphingobacterium bovistauri TaxID=2781959 RepID=A0ABS7Z5Y7_9SPHI|nr:NAD(P)/FAD-dependent oxidoreductase [Sphingobacterium bovistauri]MCA5005603.1 FAD-dependent monooxygenase [Sphingobacterium bovistauri]